MYRQRKYKSYNKTSFLIHMLTIMYILLSEPINSKTQNTHTWMPIPKTQNISGETNLFCNLKTLMIIGGALVVVDLLQ